MNICLVDDDDVINTVHGAVIRVVKPDAVVRIFKSGQAFIDALNNGALRDFVPDVVFLDIRMPEMDGFGVLQNLDEYDFEEMKGSKIFMLSSTLDERDLTRATSHDRITRFIGKPLTFDQMRELLS